MQISRDLLQRYSSLEGGKIYYGSFAKDGSDHAGVVITIVDDKVHVFCITSSKDFIEAQKRDDGPDSVVEIPKEIVTIVFTEQQKKSWIYGGKANLKVYTKEEFLGQLSKGLIKLKYQIDDSLMADLRKAIKSSITYTPDELAALGI